MAKRFICQCHCLRCHYSPLTMEESLVTWTDLSNGHIDEHVGESATSV